MEEQAREVLSRVHEDDISTLEHIALSTDRVADIDRATFGISDLLDDLTCGLIARMSASHFDRFEETELLEPIQFFGSTDERPMFSPQLLFLHQCLRLLCSYSSKLRDIISGQSGDAYKDILESLGILWGESDKHKRSNVHRRHLMERQLWRLQDLRDGGGFGFCVESFLLVARQMIMLRLPPDAQSSLILGIFRAATSNWRQHKHSIGTQRVILNLICDMAIPDRGVLFHQITFPRYLTDEFLVLVENIVEGQSGSHIDEVMKELKDAIEGKDDVAEQRMMKRCLFAEEVVKVISRSRAPVPSL
ncbi:hypothetical protein EI94DRAFT_1813624 [Lactarius quietus]|nr:hypothetical protein EI94DRAFT_1813624 [Lactarius quietus]